MSALSIKIQLAPFTLHSNMCQYLHEIKPKKSRHTLFVGCGHCPSCLQAKADRRGSRIRNHNPKGFRKYFITLSYDDKSVPYIRHDEYLDACRKISLGESFNLPIYRNSRYVFDRKLHSYIHRPCPPHIEYYLDGSGCSKSEDPAHRCKNVYSRVLQGCDTSFESLPRLRYKDAHGNFVFDSSRVGVLVNIDVQNFFKRLRKRYSKKYGYTPLSYYVAPEYGPTTCRPHFHIILWLPDFLSKDELADYVCESWPFASSRRTRKYVEDEICSSAYISKYINCSSSVPRFLQVAFPPRPCHSCNFGFDKVAFSFDAVFNTFRSHRFPEYVSTSFKSTCGEQRFNCLYPQYVIYRYFAKCVGFGRINRSTLYNVYINPPKYLAIVEDEAYPPRFTVKGDVLYPRNIRDVNGDYIYMSSAQASMFFNGLLARYKKYYILHLEWEDYARFVVDSLISYSLSFIGYMYKYNSENIEDVVYNYDNSFDFLVLGKGYSDLGELYYNLSSCPDIPAHPVYYPANIERDLRLVQSFDKNIKHRKLSIQEIDESFIN